MPRKKQLSLKRKPEAKELQSDESTEGLIEASSLRRALNVIGDVWTVLLLREFFSGQHRFLDLQSRLGIPRQTLLLRLTALTEQQCLYRKPVPHSLRQFEYHLTPKGLDLYPFILAVWSWHLSWDHNFAFLPARLIHLPCSQRLDPELRCMSCNKPVSRSDLEFFPGPGKGFDPRPSARSSRQNESAHVKTLGDDDTSLVGTVLIGDRWSYLILSSMFRGTTSFSAIVRQLQISSNILTSRLKKLLKLGLIEPAQESNGRRIDYRFSDRGEDIFAMILTVARWGDRWLAGFAGPPEIALHDCGAVLDIRYACRVCDLTVRPWDVNVKSTG